MKTLKDKVKYDSLNYHNVPIINLRFVDVKEAVLEFETELKKLTYQTSKEDYILSIINVKEKFKEIFGDFEK